MINLLNLLQVFRFLQPYFDWWDLSVQLTHKTIHTVFSSFFLLNWQGFLEEGKDSTFFFMVSSLISVWTLKCFIDEDSIPQTIPQSHETHSSLWTAPGRWGSPFQPLHPHTPKSPSTHAASTETGQLEEVSQRPKDLNQEMSPVSRPSTQAYIFWKAGYQQVGNRSSEVVFFKQVNHSHILFYEVRQ